jgi:nickel superoxide dismutase
MKTHWAVPLLFVLVAGAGRPAWGHCEIPCGIYDDEARFSLFREHIATVEKSMNAIRDLGAQSKPDWNQLVRWIDNKEAHANKIQELATQYFLTQRIKTPTGPSASGQAKYAQQLELMHRLLVTAMKMKQTTDAEQVREATRLVDAFERSYLGHGASK